MIYDISAFSRARGIRRGGGWECARNVLLFQRKLDSAERHLLQFEVPRRQRVLHHRRALRLVRGAIEIQRFYSEMNAKASPSTKACAWPSTTATTGSCR
jgi:hypothetical protein